MKVIYVFPNNVSSRRKYASHRKLRQALTTLQHGIILHVVDTKSGVARVTAGDISRKIGKPIMCSTSIEFPNEAQFCLSEV